MRTLSPDSAFQSARFGGWGYVCHRPRKLPSPHSASLSNYVRFKISRSNMMPKGVHVHGVDVRARMRIAHANQSSDMLYKVKWII